MGNQLVVERLGYLGGDGLGLGAGTDFDKAGIQRQGCTGPGAGQSPFSQELRQRPLNRRSDFMALVGRHVL
ncbi:MAG: hypothetical protein PVF74_00105 [Anaerolineales bacterium]